VNLAFYIHIPYCVKRCGYCDFNTYTPSELKITEGLAQISNSYIDLLLMEIKAAKSQVSQSANVPSIFFGGGTPSLMQPDDIGRVISTIKSEFTLLPDAEITMECNPDTVTKESLAAFRAVGVNRVSFGMQSAVKHVLATLDRTHNPENLLQATTWAKEVGFSEISVDLIYGTPGESLADWQTSIDAALTLPITHISAYALIIEEGTKLAAQIKRGEVAPVNDDLTAEKYLVADKAFTAAGYEWYELSNWAKSGSLSKHNLAYWLGDNWWGAGPGAHSHLNGKRFWNVKHPNLYKERVLANQSPVADSEALDELQIESERLMLSLRLPGGLDKKSLNELQLAELSSYVQSGHLDQANWNQGRATLTLDGRLIADRILRQILL
jgi:oxygen-independent coproporphyrinogen-3 oxidase